MIGSLPGSGFSLYQMGHREESHRANANRRQGCKVECSLLLPPFKRFLQQSHLRLLYSLLLLLLLLVIYGVVMASKICQLLRSRSIDQILSRVFTSPARSIASLASSSNPIRATLFPGDGIGPEIAESVKQVPLLSQFSYLPFFFSSRRISRIFCFFFLLDFIVFGYQGFRRGVMNDQLWLRGRLLGDHNRFVYLSRSGTQIGIAYDR